MFKLPDLPYAADALAPVLSATQMSVHHDKHHAKYISNLNGMLAAAGESPESLEAVVSSASGDAAKKKLFNNAAQAWNHAFFWRSMAPAPSKPSAALAAAIDRSFGGLDGLRTRFVGEGADHFGSGWAWLVARGAELAVLSTHDAASVVGEAGVTPLLTADVWEHAYYLDYKQDRKGFLEAWFDRLANWPFAEAQYAAATGAGSAWTFPV